MPIVDYTRSINALTSSGTVATVTMGGHGFVPGRNFMIYGANDPVYNGRKTITEILVEATTSNPHGLSQEDQIIANPGGTSFDGVVTIAEIISATKFSYWLPQTTPADPGNIPTVSISSVSSSFFKYELPSVATIPNIQVQTFLSYHGIYIVKGESMTVDIPLGPFSSAYASLTSNDKLRIDFTNRISAEIVGTYTSANGNLSIVDSPTDLTGVVRKGTIRFTLSEAETALLPSQVLVDFFDFLVWELEVEKESGQVFGLGGGKVIVQG